MPRKSATPKLMHRAGELRRAPTKAETKLWLRLRGHRLGDIHFRRQHAIGHYIVDFCAPRRKLIIEVDGGQHLDQREYDAERTTFLEGLGYRVLRFWNNDILKDMESVLHAIDLALQADGQDNIG